KVWNLEGTELATIEGGGKPIRPYRFSPNGNLLVTYHRDHLDHHLAHGICRLWNIDAKPVREEGRRRPDVLQRYCYFSSDSKWLLERVLCPTGSTTAVDEYKVYFLPDFDRPVMGWEHEDNHYLITTPEFAPDSRHLVGLESKEHQSPAFLDWLWPRPKELREVM